MALIALAFISILQCIIMMMRRRKFSKQIEYHFAMVLYLLSIRINEDSKKDGRDKISIFNNLRMIIQAFVRKA